MTVVPRSGRRVEQLVDGRRFRRAEISAALASCLEEPS